MESLNGRCTSTDRGFWTYEVCIGKSITQKHQQERYVMGRTVVPSSDPSSKFQKYVDGEVCGAVTGEPKRETTVSMSKRTRTMKIFTNNNLVAICAQKITYACGDIFDKGRKRDVDVRLQRRCHRQVVLRGQGVQQSARPQ